MPFVAPSGWTKVKEIFLHAAEKTGEARARYLNEACGSDQQLRCEVERLMEGDAIAGSLLDDGAAGEAAALITQHQGLPCGGEVGPYRLLGLLGEGGMGAVYLAERADGQFNQTVALKLVRPGMDYSVVVERFRHERQILARLSHDNIARLLDGGTTGEGLPYFVLEFIDGLPIDEYAPRNRLTVAARLDLFVTVCLAVHYLHQNLVIHRDLKPTNILVTGSGVPKLLDFGIAKLTDGPDANQATTLRFLTPEYASPEQIRGAPMSTASDVYSLGVVLRRLVSLDGSQPKGDLRTIVGMALREEPERRYASAQQLAEDITRYRRGMPVLARKDTVRYRAARFIGRHRAGAGAVLAMVLLTVFAGAALEREAGIAQRRFDEVRSLASSLVFELHDAVEKLPGATRAQELLVKRALEYLDRLAAESSGDARLQRELASAYERIATIQGQPHYSNMGDNQAALGNYRKSMGLFRALGAEADIARVSDLIGGVLHHTGRLDEAAACYAETLAIAERLAARDPVGRASRRRLALALQITAELEGNPFYPNRGKTAEAAQLQARALALFESLHTEDPGEEKGRGDLARALDKTAQIARAGAQTDKMLRLYTRALEIRIALAAERPNDAIIQRALAHSYCNVADMLLWWRDDPRQAMALYETALAIQQALSDKDPADLQQHRDAALSRMKIADALHKLNLPERARRYLAEARVTFERLAQVSPANSVHRRDLMMLDDRLGENRALAGDHVASLAYRRQALRAAEAAAAATHRDKQSDADLLIAIESVGDSLMANGDAAGALESFTRGVALAESMATSEPDDVRRKLELAIALGKQGGALQRLARPGQQWLPVLERSAGLFLAAQKSAGLRPSDAAEYESVKKLLARQTR